MNNKANMTQKRPLSKNTYPRKPPGGRELLE
jgi:hypothetical protein